MNCPLMTTPSYPVKCGEEKCGWWDVVSNVCCLVSLIWKLEEITSELNMLVDRLGRLGQTISIKDQWKSSVRKPWRSVEPTELLAGQLPTEGDPSL